ncbi:ATP-dependent DNA ligase [Allorhizocola rhizosphaerae]|uniref:ATP-dependent DNA ligase n=1 Tax=Allorhizocola rhizosphaerae TaxID=1872709 RepID=UPI000E3C41C8|nr:ATP-dependent DNA ligase [Allorhizocola rhizosphaerae]
MTFTLAPPIEPMLAKAVPELPIAEGMSYEPKWDGFRCIIFRDGDDVELGSRTEKAMTRYFPEVVEQVRAQFPARCVVDAELVVIRRDAGKLPRLDFELLGQRIHPADSRVRKLSVETPADIICFDLLALDADLTGLPFAQRRARLEQILADAGPPVHLTPATTDPAQALRWFEEFEGAGLDGLIAKLPDTLYEPGKRLMYKVKHARTADAVVAGFRWHKQGEGIVGSLVLGLYDKHGTLHHVGVSSSFSMQRRRELVDEIAPYRDPATHPWLGSTVEGQRLPGAPSRWSGTKNLEFIPLEPKLVVEVAYDAMEGDRFRHTAQFKRWRPDREPGSCTYDQLERPLSLSVDDVLGPAAR